MNPSLQPGATAATDPLAQLRDIHLPDAISWWPLAPGWWALLAVILALIAGAVILEARRRRSLRYRALAELHRLETRYGPQSPTLALAADICTLVKRIVISVPEGRKFAAAHGESWGEYLSASPGGMPPEVARYIASAPYRLEPPCDGAGDPPEPGRETLLQAAAHWIGRHA